MAIKSSISFLFSKTVIAKCYQLLCFQLPQCCVRILILELFSCRLVWRQVHHTDDFFVCRVFFKVSHQCSYPLVLLICLPYQSSDGKRILSHHGYLKNIEPLVPLHNSVVVASCRNTCKPTRCDNEELLFDEDEPSARSAMLTMNSSWMWIDVTIELSVRMYLLFKCRLSQMELDEVRGLRSLLVLFYKQCFMFISMFNLSITTTNLLTKRIVSN